MPHVHFQRLHPAAQPPRYAHTGPFGDLAADLHSICPHTLAPGETLAIPTGLALAFPAELGGVIHDRSSLALRGLHTLAGVIDPGYRGELRIILTNLSPTPQTLAAGARIAQLRIVPLLQAEFFEAQTLDETLRSDRGFGSTGA